MKDRTARQMTQNCSDEFARIYIEFIKHRTYILYSVPV